jgi:glycosyltransferase involved in cell wall biosynthesis
MVPERENPAMPAPGLALCIPAFNAAWCLPRLLASAEAQEKPFDEILVYDDCSTDDTAAVAARHGARVIRGLENLGCSAGKNRLAEAAASDWLHFHDADDELLPSLVGCAGAWMERQQGPDVVLLNFEYRDFTTGELLGRPRYDRALLTRDPVAFVLSAKVPNFGLYRRRAFLDAGGFDTDPAVLFNEDAAFHHRLALAGLRFDYEPTLSCMNYRYGGSMSAANQAKCAEAQLHVLEKTTMALHDSGIDRYDGLLADSYWRVAQFAATWLAWPVADAAARGATELGARMPTCGGMMFRLAGLLHAGVALRAREYGIRRFRPHLRCAIER